MQSREIDEDNIFEHSVRFLSKKLVEKKSF